MSPRADTFFEVVLSFLLTERPPSASRVNGAIAFSVEGAGIWSVELTRGAVARVRRGLSPRRPAVHVHIAASFFPTFVRGSFDAEAALAQKKLVVEGDADLLGELADLLALPGVAALRLALPRPASGVALRGATPTRHEPNPKGAKV